MSKSERQKIMREARKKGLVWYSSLARHRPGRFRYDAGWYFDWPRRFVYIAYVVVKILAPTRALAEEAAMQAAKVLLRGGK